MFKKILSKITHVHVSTASGITLLATLVLGFLAPYLPMFARTTLAYASGWLVELVFIFCAYLIVTEWDLLGAISKYFLVSGIAFLILMYGLWLCFDYGQHYPYISAIGFNIGTIFRSVAICLLMGITINQQHKINNLK